MAGEKVVLIYDGECSICAGAVAWIERRAVPGAFEFLACQSPERGRRFPALSEGACLEAMQLVLPGGGVLAGDRAIPEIVARLRRWRWLSITLRRSGVGGLASHAYAWIARHRHAIVHTLRHPPRRGHDAAGSADTSSSTSNHPG